MMNDLSVDSRTLNWCEFLLVFILISTVAGVLIWLTAEHFKHLVPDIYLIFLLPNKVYILSAIESLAMLETNPT